MAEQLIRRRRPGRLSAGHASRLAAQLTERDRRIALDCYDHRVLTTAQLQRLHFRTVRVAQRRLQQLYELRVLERFRPPWQRPHGSTPPWCRPRSTPFAPTSPNKAICGRKR